MTQLSKRLRRYYQRKKHRVMFVNGDTLNLLALKIAQETSYGFDAAALSRVINGKRLFKLYQLDAFCTILKLTPKEDRELHRALFQDILARAGWEEHDYLSCQDNGKNKAT